MDFLKNGHPVNEETMKAEMRRLNNKIRVLSMQRDRLKYRLRKDNQNSE